tara:strand:+ start:248 stop:418 length:171 start_codon:yes stop_codon:yes gene_type:complete
MAELIPGAASVPESDSTTVEVTSVKNDQIFEVNVEDLLDTADDYANWVHFGVGGPA